MKSGRMFKVAPLLGKLFFIGKIYLCFSLFMLVLIYPAVVLGFGSAACCYGLSWRILHKARQRRDKSRGFQWYFGSFWNAVFKFREQIYGKSKTNYYRQCSFLTSEGRGMEE